MTSRHDTFVFWFQLNENWMLVDQNWDDCEKREKKFMEKDKATYLSEKSN